MALRPLILLSNDDGFRALGLLEMRAALAEIADVVVCAPHSEQSASSHPERLGSERRALVGDSQGHLVAS